MGYLRDNGSLDVVRFAREFVASAYAIDDAERKVTVEQIGERCDTGATIRFAEDSRTAKAFNIGAFSLILYAVNHPHKDQGKVTVSIRPDGIGNTFLGNSTSQYPALPSVRISTDRPLETLARDVGKRVLGDSVESITKRRALAAQYDDYDARTKATAEAVAAAFPKARVKLPDQHANPGASADFSVYFDGNPADAAKIDSGLIATVSGRIQGDSVYLDRCSIKPEHLTALLRSIYGE